MEIHKEMWRAHFAETREENSGDTGKTILLGILLKKSSWKGMIHAREGLRTARALEECTAWRPLRYHRPWWSQLLKTMGMVPKKGQEEELNWSWAYEGRSKAVTLRVCIIAWVLFFSTWTNIQKLCSSSIIHMKLKIPWSIVLPMKVLEIEM